MVGDIGQPSHFNYYMFLCSFLWYYILCIFNMSPQAVVIVRSKFFSANRHIKVHVLCGAMWLPYINILFIQNTGYFCSH